MSCGRVETGLGKGGAGGRLLLYKTHRCILNYVNVFLVKTIKRIIFKKNVPRKPAAWGGIWFRWDSSSPCGHGLELWPALWTARKMSCTGLSLPVPPVPGLLSCCPVEMPPCQVPLLHQNRSSPPPLSPGCSQPAICTSYQNPQAAGFNFLLWEGRRGRGGSIK